MRAEKTTAAQLFTAGQQMTVPIWQRPFSWKAPQWTELWEDIKRVRTHPDPGLTHFLGSIVVRQDKWIGLPSHARRFSVVDGQQRIATLTVLLIAIRDRIGELTSTEARDKLTRQLFTNTEFAAGHQERLTMQDGDNPALQRLIGSQPKSDSALEACHTFYAKLLQSHNKDELLALIQLIQTRFDLVWISLEDSDDAHRVFQTINAGGKPLRQADLVRNFFFLLLAGRGDDFYQQHWHTLETTFDDATLEKYFSAWSIAKGHSGSNDKLFLYFSNDLARCTDADSVWKYGATLVQNAKIFSVIQGLCPDQDQHVEREMQWLRSWQTKPAEGLLFLLFMLRDQNRLNDRCLAKCLAMIFSFFARRFLAGYEPNLHRSILVQIAHRLSDHDTTRDDDLVLLLRVLLSRGSELKTWPSNESVVDQAVRQTLYTKARRHWTHAVLGRINEAMIGNIKQAPKPSELGNFQIEHILPQTLTDDWREDLVSWGVKAPAELSQKRLHVLGNLTLTTINSELSNSRFEKKVAMIQNDSLRLNSKLKDLTEWTESRVDERSRSMATLLVKSLEGPMTPEDIGKTVFASELPGTSSDAELSDGDPVDGASEE